MPLYQAAAVLKKANLSERQGRKVTGLKGPRTLKTAGPPGEPEMLRREQAGVEASSLRTREDVRRYVEHLRKRPVAKNLSVKCWQVARRATLLSALCLAMLQYYFLSVGVDILSMPGVTVFVLSLKSSVS
jgi:hypothetical protein